MLAEAEGAVRHNDQGRAAAAIAVYGEHGHPPEPVFERMLRFTISEDGRLHGDKYFQTVIKEFHTTRPAYRWVPTHLSRRTRAEYETTLRQLAEWGQNLLIEELGRKEFREWAHERRGCG